MPKITFRKEDKATVEQRFWAKVSVLGEDDCWPWLAALDGRGYGFFRIPPREGRASGMIRASRFSLELKEGRILLPDEYACHTCNNTTCVNQKHLYVGDHISNMRDVSISKIISGERHSNCKLLDNDVAEIRRMHKEGITCKEIALIYSVHAATISRITRNISR